MKYSPDFLINSRRFFPRRIWPWVIIALKHDPMVWESLNEPEFCKRAMAILPAQIEKWTPASLSLLALDIPLTTESLTALPLAPLAQTIKSRVEQYYEDWLQNHSTLTNINQAGLIALSLREWFRLKGEWSGIFHDLGEDVTNLKCVFACLGGMVPDPQGFYRYLIDNPENCSHPELALHALLSTPLMMDDQCLHLINLLDGIPQEKQLFFIRLLKEKNPSLANIIAQEILLGRGIRPAIEGTKKFYAFPEISSKKFEYSDELREICQLMQEAEIHHIARSTETLEPLLVNSIDRIKQVQAFQIAQLALVQELKCAEDLEGIESSALSLWKQAAQLDTRSEVYIIGLAKALIREGRKGDAQAYLEVVLSNSKQSVNPSINIAAASIFDFLNENEKIEQYAIQAFSNLGDDFNLSEEETLTLVKFLYESGNLHEAEKIARLGIERYDFSVALSAYLTNILCALGRPEQAVQSAFFTFASEQLQTPFGIRSDSEASKHLLLINCLEAAGEWSSALDERMLAIEQNEFTTVDDYHRLSFCALNAEKYQQAVNFSLQALDIDANDDEAFGLLGEAFLRQGDYPKALESYQKATRLLSQKSKYWINLADVYRIIGSDGKYYETLRAGSYAAPNEPEIHLALGEAYLAQSSLTQALSAFRTASRMIILKGVGPKINNLNEYIDRNNDENDLSLRIAYRLGETLNKLGFIEEARLGLKEAYTSISNDLIAIETGLPFFANKYLLYASISHEYGKAMSALGGLDEAANAFRSVIRMQPNNYFAQLDLAKVLIRIKDQPRAAEEALLYLEQLDTVLTSEDGQSGRSGSLLDGRQFSEVKALKAEALAIIGDFQNSKEAYRLALDSDLVRDPNWRCRLSFGLGSVAKELNEPELAIAAIKEVIHIEPDNFPARKLLAEECYISGLYEDAYLEAKTALNISGADDAIFLWFIELSTKIAAGPNNNQNVIYFDLIEVLKQQIIKSSNQIYPYIQLCKIYLNLGDQKEALNTIQRVANDEMIGDGTQISYLLQAAILLKELEDFESATLVLLKALAISSQQDILVEKLEQNYSIVLHRELAEVYHLLKDINQALEVLDAGIRLYPNCIPLYIDKANLLSESEGNEGTISFLESAIDQFPDDIHLKKLASNIYYQKGELFEALKIAEEAYNSQIKNESSITKYELACLCAGLAQGLMLYQRGLNFFSEINIDELDEIERIELVCSQAELALSLDDDYSATIATQSLDINEFQSPRLLALKARLHYRKGEVAEARQLFEKVLKSSRHLTTDVSKRDLDSTNSSYFRLLRSVGEAAKDIGEWDTAVESFSAVVRIAPQELLSHADKVTSLILRAEAKRLCNLLDVKSHSPDDNAISSETYSDFIKEMGEIETQLKHKSWNDISTPNFFNYLITEFSKLRLRGEAVFNPGWDTCENLFTAMISKDCSLEEIAAVILASQMMGDGKKAAIHQIQNMLENEPVGQSLKNQPLILTLYTILLTDLNPNLALDIAIDALESTSIYSCGKLLHQPMVHYLLARLAYQNQILATSLQAIRRALDEWSSEPEWWALASKIYQSKDATLGLPNIDYSVSCLDQAIGLAPQNWKYYHDQGKLYLEIGEHLKACQALEKATKNNPDNTEGWLLLAKSQMITGQYELAGLSIEHIIESKNEKDDALKLKAELQILQNKPEEAHEIVKSILSIKPEDPIALHLLARSLVALNRPDEALAVLENVSTSSDDHLSLQLDRLHLIKGLHGVEAAMPILQELLMTHPQQPELLAEQADCYSFLGDFDQAIFIAQQAISLNQGELTPQSLGNLHLLIGSHFRNVGQLDQAIHHLGTSLQYDPINLDTSLELGKAYADRRQFKEALSTYYKCIRTNPNDYRPYYLAGILSKELKNYPEAEKLLQKASQFAPDDINIQRLLGAVVAINLVNDHRSLSAENNLR